MDSIARRFHFRECDFERICGIVKEHSGIELNNKQDLVYARIAKRIRALNLNSFSEYLSYLMSNSGLEHENFINALTTNLTSFFREEHHFRFLTQAAIPFLLKKNRGQKRMRIWSAGCSTGEEVYSIAMTVAECVDLSEWDIKILGTDLDTNVIRHAYVGEYSYESVKCIPDDYLGRWFTEKRKEESVTFKVKSSLRDTVFFQKLNLFDQWPMSGPFDIIFCRNVVIYFDQASKNKLFKRFHDILCPNGYLIVGHSERIESYAHLFRHCDLSAYQKICD